MKALSPTLPLNKNLCYYIIVKTRASKGALKILGEAFHGIIVSDFWKAYNLVKSMAKQKIVENHTKPKNKIKNKSSKE